MGSLGVFSLAGELPGTVTNVMAGSHTYPGSSALPPTHWGAGPWSRISPVKVTGTIQDQALPGLPCFLSPVLGFRSYRVLLHKDAANKCRCFHFNEKSCKELGSLG